MKRQATIATLAIALLPVAAQASIASRQAMQANHEPLQRAEAQQQTTQEVDQRFSGESAGVAAHAYHIAADSRQRTDLPETDHIGAEKPEVGHAADW